MENRGRQSALIMGPMMGPYISSRFKILTCTLLRAYCVGWCCLIDFIPFDILAALQEKSLVISIILHWQANIKDYRINARAFSDNPRN